MTLIIPVALAVCLSHIYRMRKGRILRGIFIKGSKLKGRDQLTPDDSVVVGLARE